MVLVPSELQSVLPRSRTQSLKTSPWWPGREGPGQSGQARWACKRSGMDLEGEQLLRVHVVERAQVRQLEQQLGEDGRLVGVVLGDEAAQGADQRLLQGLHRVHVLDARAI